MRWTLRTAGAAVFVAAAIGAASSAATKGKAPFVAAARTVVVAELFTSEGCSSCPPADDLLRQLLSTQPIDGVEIVGLGSHVDYWDYLGWRDPFSSALFSERQSSYDAAVFRSNRIYTPQLVVDGTFECVASDAVAVRRTIVDAAKALKGTLTLSAVAGPGTTDTITIRGQIPAGVRRDRGADVIVAVTQDGLMNRVQQGENRGRALSHSAVVRSMTPVGHLTSQQVDVNLSTTIRLEPGWGAGALRIVAFVQEATSRRIIAAGSVPFVAGHVDPS